MVNTLQRREDSSLSVGRNDMLRNKPFGRLEIQKSSGFEDISFSKNEIHMR